MSKTTKRKHVQRETRDDYFAPPSEGQSIVRILNSRGNNLHEVESADNSKYLVSMPTKFRKNIWVKRGDYVIVEPIREGDKVKAEMVRVLSKEHIKYFKKINVWPASFEITVDEVGNRHRAYSESTSTTSESSTDSSDTSEEEDDDDSEDEQVQQHDDKSTLNELKTAEFSYGSHVVNIDKMAITSGQSKAATNKLT